MKALVTVPTRDFTCLIGAILLTAYLLSPSLASGQWTNVGVGGGGSNRSLAFSPGTDKKLIIGGDVGGIYVSNPANNYRQFNVRNQGIINYRINSLVFHPTDSNIAYAGTAGGVAKSVDGGNTWEMKRQGFEPLSSGGRSAPVYPIAIDPNDPQVVYAGLGLEYSLGSGFTSRDYLGYVYKSVNGGDNWQPIDVGGITDQSIMSIVIDPTNSGKLYLLSQRKLFVSTTSGAEWGEQATLPHPDATYTSLVVKRDEPNVILVSYAQRGTNNTTGVLKSTDYGITWQEVISEDMPSSGAGINHVRTHPTETGTFFITFYTNAFGLYRSTDSGETWDKINNLNIPVDDAWFIYSEKTTDVAVDPNNPDVICYLSSHQAAVYLSEDGGQNWEQISTVRTANGTYQSTGLNVLVANDIAVHPDDPNTLLVGYLDRSLFKSTDGGQSFFKGTDVVYEFAAHVFDIAPDPDDSNTVYLTRRQGNSSTTGVYKTTNFGESFQQIGGSASGLSGELMYDIEIDPLDETRSTLYVATQDAGVFKTSDGGGYWAAINSGLPTANLQTYDIAIDPTDSQTLYVAARVGSISGYVAKSIDGGATWNVVLGRDAAGILHDSEVDIRTVVVDPSDPNIIYAGNRDTQGKAFDKIFWRSTNKGLDWTSISGSDAFNIGKFEYSPHTYNLQTIVPDPGQAGRLYAGFGVSGRDHRYTGGLYVSNNHGDSWDLFPDTGLQHFVANNVVIDPQVASRLYFASGGNDFYRYGPAPSSCLTTTGKSFYGTVKTTTRKAAPDVRIVLNGPNGCSDVILTDNKGKYTFGPLANGDYTAIPGGGGCSSFTPAKRSATLNGGSVRKQDFTATCP